jgi:hypothetical protein
VQVYFRCRRSLRHEGDNLDGSSEALRGHATLGSFETGEFIADPFSQYKKAVEAYSKRALTSQSDILNAFIGISSALYRPYRERFISGLPESNFDDALLWEPDPADGPFCQRIAPSFMPLPSWSWISHQGHVIFDSEPLLGSLVDWYGYVEEAEGLIPFRATKKRINDDRFTVDVSDLDLPQSYTPTVGTSFSGYDAYSDHHDAYREFPPEADALAKRPGRLLFRTQSAFFKLRTYKMDGNNNPGDSIATLAIFGNNNTVAGFIDMEGIWISLFLPSDDQLEERYFQFVALSAAESPKYWVARAEAMITTIRDGYQTSRDIYTASKAQTDVSSGTGNISYFDGSRGAALKPPPVVNVMLIEWQDGVARRLGLGKILLKSWKSADPVVKTIVLE